MNAEVIDVRLVVQACVSVKLCRSERVEGQVPPRSDRAFYVVQKCTVSASHHRTDRLEANSAGDKSSLHILRAGRVAIEPSLVVTVTPETLLHAQSVVQDMQRFQVCLVSSARALCTFALC